MAYDPNNAYVPPTRGYLVERAQSPAYRGRRADQGAFDSLPTAHDNRLDQEHATQPRPTGDRQTHTNRGRTGRDESRRREASRPARRPLLDQPSPGESPMAQDNAFPVFPTKRSVAAAAAAAHHNQRPPRDASRPRDHAPTANASPNLRPPNSQSDPRQAPNTSHPRPSTADAPRPPPHSRFQDAPNPSSSFHPLPQPPPQPHHPPHTRSQDPTAAGPSAHLNTRDQRHPYRSPPQQPPPQLAPLPTFSPPYSASSRPSTSDSANGRERPFLAPLDTHVAADPHSVESPLLSSVTARHRPAIVPVAHAPYEARISQAAHLSNASAYQDDFAHPQQPWNPHADKHESLGGVYDDYYQDPPRPMNREDEIEAAMPDFDRPTAHKRGPTIDEHLNNMHLNSPAQPAQPQQGYQTASSKLKSAKSQPDLRQRTPVQDEVNAFDFGFQPQQLTQSPEPHNPAHLPHHPAQALYHHTQSHREQPWDRARGDQHSTPARPPQPPQHDHAYRNQSSTPLASLHRLPQPPQSNYGYNAQVPMPEPPIHDPARNEGYDVRADQSGRPLKAQQYEQGYAHQIMPTPDQQRSQSYDDPSSGPPRPPQQQRAFTSDDQDLYHGQQYGGQRPMQRGGPMQRGPMPNGHTTGAAPNGYMPHGPSRRGPTSIQGPIGGMPSGSLPNGQGRRGLPPPRSTPPGSMPPGPIPMNGGPRSQSRGPQSRRPVPGQQDFRPGENRLPAQRRISGDRAPSAPAMANGFAPPPARQADYGYGPDPAMVGRGPNPRFAMDDRSPSAPATRNGFAPPTSSDHPIGAPLAKQRSAPQTIPGAQQYGYNQSANPDGLPSHPVPVRPGLNNGPPAPKPAPVRNYANNPELSSSSHAQSQPKSSTGADTGNSGPVTKGELDTLRSRVEANPNDMKTAMVLVKKLVEASTVLASENGRLDAKSTAKNSERYVLDAHKRVKKLAAANYPEAMFYLADCYGSGDLGLEPDPKQAFSLYQGAAKAGHGAAAYRTAMCCEMGAEEGGGTKRDYHKAVQWYQRASQLQDVAAMYKMGMILLRGLLGQQRNVGQSVAYLKRAADNADANNPHAIHELARLHEEGNPDPAISAAVKPDEKYAQKMYMQAAKMGYKQSQFRLGQAFEYGSLGLPVDSRNSIAWYSKAAAQGEHNSELALSGWYLTGAEGILNQSDTEAYLWARKAATSEPPLAKAMYALGYYIENGIGCPASLEEGKKWYTRAASYKFPKAVERLEEIRKGKAAKPQPNQGRLTRSNQKRDEAECVVM
ncbi:HCP-like protein [Aureobasidium sp. EXF-10728]|nr:HCP-like protein [Aureobasidium sp. EXF-10728]